MVERWWFCKRFYYPRWGIFVWFLVVESSLVRWWTNYFDGLGWTGAKKWNRWYVCWDSENVHFGRRLWTQNFVCRYLEEVFLAEFLLDTTSSGRRIEAVSIAWFENFVNLNQWIFQNVDENFSLVFSGCEKIPAKIGCVICRTYMYFVYWC